MRSGVFLAILAFSALAAFPLRAQMYAPPPWAAREHAREGVERGEILPLDRLLPSIRRSHPGTFYDAQGPFRGPNGDYRYRLKWLTPDGRVIWLDTDARTGRVSNAPRERARDYFQDRYGRGRAGVGAPPPAERFGPSRFRHVPEEEGRAWRRGGYSHGGGHWNGHRGGRRGRD